MDVGPSTVSMDVNFIPPLGDAETLTFAQETALRLLKQAGGTIDQADKRQILIKIIRPLCFSEIFSAPPSEP